MSEMRRKSQLAQGRAEVELMTPPPPHPRQLSSPVAMIRPLVQNRVADEEKKAKEIEKEENEEKGAKGRQTEKTVQMARAAPKRETTRRRLRHHLPHTATRHPGRSSPTRCAPSSRRRRSGRSRPRRSRHRRTSSPRASRCGERALRTRPRQAPRRRPLRRRCAARAVRSARAPRGRGIRPL